MKLSSLIVEIWWLICSIELSPHLSTCVKHYSFKHVARLLHRVKGYRVNFLTLVKEIAFYSLIKVPASFVSRGKLCEACCQKLLCSICHNYRVLENNLNSNFLIIVKNKICRLSRKNSFLYSHTPRLDSMFYA